MSAFVVCNLLKHITATYCILIQHISLKRVSFWLHIRRRKRLVSKYKTRLEQDNFLLVVFPPLRSLLSPNVYKIHSAQMNFALLI